MIWEKEEIKLKNDIRFAVDRRTTEIYCINDHLANTNCVLNQ